VYNILKLLLIIVVYLNILNADDISIDNLLNDIEAKSDLSSKTKLENGGVRFIYTRSDLDRMQARNLKDILKSTYPIGYGENRYGLVDPLSSNGTTPFISNNIRIFIDDQEVTNGLYGSGLITIGDMDIGFVDHIEVYNGNPTYEFSTEVTFTLIKLYSKVASKDGGNKLLFSYGSYNASNFAFYNSSELENDWAYFAYISQNNDNRKKHISHSTKLSRDKVDTHFFTSIYNDNNHIIIDAMTQKRDSFINRSLDATPLDATMNIDNIHIGYNGSYNNLSYLLSYDYGKANSNFLDDLGLLKSVVVNSKASVINSEIKYTYETNINKFIIGLKYRLKQYKYDEFLLNNFPVNLVIPTANLNNTKQTISNIFIENQYSIQSNTIITTGISKSSIKNNNTIQNDDLLMYRLGFTHTNENWIFKTLYSHNEKVLDPYMVSGEGVYITPGKKKPQKENLIMENIIYEKGNNKYEVVLSKLKTKNHFFPNITTGLLENYNKELDINSFVFGYTHHYNEYDKFYMTVGYNKIKNLPLYDHLKEYSMTFLNLNKFKSFDIFNEVLYYKNNIQNKSYFDYSLGITYQKTEDLSISLKGINILDKARKSYYQRINPTTSLPETPLGISSIDRSIMLTLEYTF